MTLELSEHPVDISIVIPYYNDPEKIIRCIDSVNASSEMLPQDEWQIEIIVVDDNSPIPFVSGESMVELTCVRHKKNIGAGAARNTGARIAKGSYILFLDSDVILHKDHLPTLVTILKDTNVEILQGPTGAFPANLSHGMFQKYLAAAWNYYGKTNGKIAVFTQCALVRKNFFYSMGGFDESYKKSGGEEFEFALRLGNHNADAITYDERLVHYHHFDKIVKRMKKVYLRSRHIMDIALHMPNLPFRFKAESLLRSSFAFMLNCFFLTILISPGAGAMAYMVTGVLSFTCDWRFSYHMFKHQSWQVAVMSVFYRQMEYSFINLGMAAGLLRRRFGG